MRLRATEAIFRLKLRGRNAIQFDALSLVGGGKFRVILAGGKARYAMRARVAVLQCRSLLTRLRRGGPLDLAMFKLLYN